MKRRIGAKYWISSVPLQRLSGRLTFGGGEGGGGERERNHISTYRVGY